MSFDKLNLFIFLVFASLYSCNRQAHQPEPLFTELPSTTTHIDFRNDIESSGDMNVFNYINFYHGGGVAIGDVNNDGLPDVYFTANQSENRLYLNKGKFQFEDITEHAATGGTQGWSTGVTMADVNQDGLMDIYVCNSGDVKGDRRKNELFINEGAKNGYPSFSERAQEYGLADEGYSTHAAFFDYDRDGDLDCFLLENSSYPVSHLGYANIRNIRNRLGGDKLFRNDNGHFNDISEEAGIYGSLIGYGLGITVGDVNNDNWPDIFISNDFYERDYLYINNRNGTFSEQSKDWMRHESLSSMGADIADLNNDGNLDLFVTDMLPANDIRLKNNFQFENYGLEQLKLSRDFYFQYLQNVLQLNNGDNTFSEIGRLSGVAATDWSWGALIFDMDNDGQKDIFVANGIYKDITNQDFVNFLADEETMKLAVEGGGFGFNKRLIDKMPSQPIPNYAFRNQGHLSFSNKAVEWGLSEPSFSNGSAYGDLDKDGDLDLIVNNVNMPAFIYKNNATEKLNNNFLRVRLKGSKQNLDGIGAKIYVHRPNSILYLQQMPNRGFQSSVDHTLVFGLGRQTQIDSLTVVWPDDKMQQVRNVRANSEIVLNYNDASQVWRAKKNNKWKPFRDVTGRVKLNYTHHESSFVDYNRDPLLKQMLSTQGPALATGDVDGDGLDDVYLGGAAGSHKKLYLQQKNGSFIEKRQPAFAGNIPAEDIAAAFFDCDNDTDLDLVVITGSNEFLPDAPELIDILYRNDGKGNFTVDPTFPGIAENGSCVAAADFDRDGDIDLFIGSRMISGSYGLDPPSYLFLNTGAGDFKNYTRRYLPKNELGMITDATWADLNADSFPELIVVGDWMPVIIYENKQGRQLIPHILRNTEGWWNAVKAADIDSDGDVDLILGNQGRNGRIPATVAHPAELVTGDFDRNGTVEQIISCFTEDGKSYPIVMKQDLQKQIPAIKKIFNRYSDYAGKQLKDIFTKEALQQSTTKKVVNPNTSLLINKKHLRFKIQALPVEAQFAPIHAIEMLDYNRDGRLDLLLAGNFFDMPPEMARFDASYGLVLQQLKDGTFFPVKAKVSGLLLNGQTRRSSLIKGASGEDLIIFARNNAKVQVEELQLAPSVKANSHDRHPKKTKLTTK